jgi:hypothetical protein
LGGNRLNEIRNVVLSDIPRLPALYEELGDKEIRINPAKTQEIFAQITAMPHSAFLVAEVDVNVIGTESQTNSIYL